MLYFVTMYAQLNQGANTIKGTKQHLTVTTDGNYLRFSSDTFVVVFDKWVFMHLQFSSCSYAYQDSPSAAAPKIFFRYYYVNSSTGEKSGVMLAETTWTAGT